MLSRRVFGFAFAGSAFAGSEWVTKRGDAQGSGLQPRDNFINKESVKTLKLLWKQQFQGALSVPVIMGPFVTHRGIKEVVIVNSSADVVHCVDADLARPLWDRRIGPGGKCDPGSPALEPAPVSTAEFVPLRPVYAVSSDGMLHEIRPSDGAVTATPSKIASGPADLVVAGRGKVSATALNGCRSGGGSGPVSVNGVEIALKGNELIASADGKRLFTAALPAGFESAGLAVANGHVCFGSRDGVLYCYAIPIEM